MRPIALAVTSLAAAGCASAPSSERHAAADLAPETAGGHAAAAPSEPAPDAAEPLEIELSARARRGAESFAVAPGDTLASGDRLELSVRVTRPAHVYVVQFFASGDAAVLHPADGAGAAVPARRDVRIPPDGEWFELDGAIGEENVYVVASERDLEAVDATVAATIDEVRASSRTTERVAHAGGGGRRRPGDGRRPRVLTLETRGLVRVQGPRVGARADAAGLVVLRFSFRHAATP